MTESTPGRPSIRTGDTLEIAAQTPIREDSDLLAELRTLREFMEAQARQIAEQSEQLRALTEQAEVDRQWYAQNSQWEQQSLVGTVDR